MSVAFAFGGFFWYVYLCVFGGGGAAARGAVADPLVGRRHYPRTGQFARLLVAGLRWGLGAPAVHEVLSLQGPLPPGGDKCWRVICT